MGAIRGVECKIYLNTSIYATPTWVEWLCARDSTLSMDMGEADASCRGGGGFKMSAPTLTALEVSGTALKEKEDPTFIAMELAARGNTIVDILVMDGDRTSVDSDGWRLDAQFFNWSEQQPLEDVVAIDWTLKPARSLNKPTAVSGPQPPA